MKWEQYYDRFYDWSESTQLNRISSLTDFSSNEELCEIAENFACEKGATKLIRKALSQGVVFCAEDILTLCEFVDTELTKTLIQNCKENFSPSQIEDIENNTMLSHAEIKVLFSNKANYENITWEEYYNLFYDLSDEEKVKLAMNLKDFSATDEVVEIIFELVYLPASESFIIKALKNGVVLTPEDIEALVLCDNKKLNGYLVLNNISKLKIVVDPEDFFIFEDYMYKHDYNKLQSILGSNSNNEYEEDYTNQKQHKPGFLTALGIGLLGAKILHKVFNKEDDGE